MSVFAPVQPRLHALKSGISTRAIAIAWIFAGLSLFCFLERPPVQRTQEARVLETARQMRGTGWQGWLLPKINGSLRLQKPPLAYWTAAISYDLTGRVNNFVGRAPTAIFGWLTLGITFATANWLFDRRTACLSAGCLLCSYLFFRHERLAETDAPAALFVTLAVFSWWKAVDRPGAGASLWFNVGAVATALAVLFKGGPGAFPPLFLVTLICLRRRWGAFVDFARSGAPLVLVALALPWFVYARESADARQFRGEVDDLFSGNDHYAAFYNYFHLLLRASLPWVLLMPAAVVAAAWPALRSAAARVRGTWNESDREALENWMASPNAGLIAWPLVIFVPLCLIGNKQFHYLLPMMPPLMILVGRFLDRSIPNEGRRVPPITGALVDATLLLLPLIAAPLIFVGVRRTTGIVTSLDYALVGGIGTALVFVAIAYLSRGRLAAVVVYLFACGMLLPVTVGIWIPSTEPDNPLRLAHQVRAQLGDGPFIFYGRNYSLPLCYHLRMAIPTARTPEELEAEVARSPGLIVIGQTKNRRGPPPMPPGFVEIWKVTESGQVLDFYRASRAP